MGFEPQKFFIGLMDFFSILLPGALLTYFVQDTAGPLVIGDRYRSLAGTEAWTLFLFSSYLVGHLIFLIGSWLLDDHLYNPVRAATYEQQIRELASGKKLSSSWTRWLARLAFEKGADGPVREAYKIKQRSLDAAASSAINAFQWAKAKLTIEQPEAMATVLRLEADSKFFRSLVVVLCFLIPWALYEGRRPLAVIAAVTLVLALWRYKDQRVKATNQAYWYLITLDGKKEDAPRPLADGPVSPPTHAGGVVYRRMADKSVKYLLVGARKPPHEWVLPKGHIELSESMREAAVREVREEAGVWARIRQELGMISYTVDDKPVRVQFYLMEWLETGEANEKRPRSWRTLEDAVQQVKHDAIRLLSVADNMRSKL